MVFIRLLIFHLDNWTLIGLDPLNLKSGRIWHGMQGMGENRRLYYIVHSS